MKDCVFCQIINKESSSKLLWENERFLAFLDQKPVNPGHTLLIPKTHIEYLFDLEGGIYRELFEQVRLLEPALRAVTGAPKLGLALEGFGVPHVHLHLIPIFGVHEIDPNRAKDATNEELNVMQKKIQDALEGSVG